MPLRPYTILAVLPWCLAAPQAVGREEPAPPARALLLEASAHGALPGTAPSRAAADWLERELRAAGWVVERREATVPIPYPRRLEVAIFAGPQAPRPARERRARFDPDALPPGPLPACVVGAAEGERRAPVVGAGAGAAEDFARLAADGHAAGSFALVELDPEDAAGQVERARAARCAGILFHSSAGTSHLSLLGTPAAGFPCAVLTPAEAREVTAALLRRRVAGADGAVRSLPVGPGPVEVRLRLEAPAQERTLVQLQARLPGRGGRGVLAASSRDTWTRGDCAGAAGTVALLRAAQLLGERARGGWLPRRPITLAFWDGERLGELGSSAWLARRLRPLASEHGAYLEVGAVLGAEASEEGEGARLPAAPRVRGDAGGIALAQALAGEPLDAAPPGPGTRLATMQAALGAEAEACLELSWGARRGVIAGARFPTYERELDPGCRVLEQAAAWLAEAIARLSDGAPAAD